jgi:hypothetical protein
MACLAALSRHKEYEKKQERRSRGENSAGTILRERRWVVIILEFRTVPAHQLFCFAASRPVTQSARPDWPASRCADSMCGKNVRTETCARSGQVAQVVERSPEKAGVGGSTPSLATIILKQLAALSRDFQPTIQPTIRRFDSRFLTAFSLLPLREQVNPVAQ